MSDPAAPASPAFPDALPIDAVRDRITATLDDHASAVLVAPPGAGKTTRVPLALLRDARFLAGDSAAGRQIILLEPRRLAARAAAQRMAGNLGERVGETVGLRMRFETRIGPKTRITVVTEGVFARMLLDDPLLEDVGLVIFDEFHERSLDADFGLALARDVQTGLRPDLRILVMSATLDGARIAALLGPEAENGETQPAPVIESQGRSHPVETRYGGRDPRRPLAADMVDCILRALEAETGSILAFLPGAADIRRVEGLLTERLRDDPEVIVAPLFGALERSEQDRAIAPAPQGKRKLVLATSIAETALTIEGIRVVIDSGYTRVPRFEPGSGLTRLETVRISRAGADQRRGRAGRTQPGICYRLWEEAANGALAPFQRPEILDADLTGLVLDCAAWGETDPARLPFLDPPPAPAIAEARKLLTDLGAIEADGRMTDTGHTLRALPLPPRLARMIVAAAAESAQAARLAADCAAVLVERGLGGDDADLVQRIVRLRREGGKRAQQARAMARGWLRAVMPDTDRASPEAAAAIPDEAIADEAIGGLLVAAYPERIASARGKPGEFVMANGRGAVIDAAHPLAGEPHLAIAEISGTAARARIIAAARITRDEIRARAGGRIETREEVAYDTEARALRAARSERLGALVLTRTPLAVPETEEAARVLAQGIARDPGPAQWPWTPALMQLRARVAFLRRAEGAESAESAEGADAGWPDLSDAAFAENAAERLTPFIVGRNALTRITAGDLHNAIEALLPWDLRARLDREAPTHFTAPTGSQVPIAYDGAEPSIALRVQELFGLTTHPAIAGGRLPLVLELLSPARRPIQITRDLPGFWAGSWAEVRAQMRGRYPKHPWPEDPREAAPTRHVTKRKNQ